MNKILKLMSSLFLMAAMFGACTPESYELGSIDVKSSELVEGIAFTITHDLDNQNLVYLKSQMGAQYKPLWKHPQGYSQDSEVALKIPFEGDYYVQFGVETRGGIVYSDSTKFTINDFYAGFVSGEMWENLTGGVGNSKIWIPDTGNYGMQKSFYTCYEPTTTWQDMVSESSKPNYWYAENKTWWEPSNSDVGNTEDDLNSYMVFSLEGKAGLKVYRYENGNYVETEGTFNMNEDNHTISAVGVDFLHGEWATPNAVDFHNNFQILVLNENQLLIGNYRDPVLSGEDVCVYCWNFVSKEYADNYNPGDVEEEEPPYDGNANEDLTTSTSTTKKWQLSLTSPYDWANLDGSFLMNFNSPDDYAANDWTPYDEALIQNISLTMTKTGDASGEYTFVDGDGNQTSGTYEIDNKNNIVFNQFVSFAISGGMSLETTSQNALRLISVKENALEVITDMWLGKRNEEGKDEYMVYHFEPGETGGSSESEEDAIRRLLCAKTWKLDMENVSGNGGPITFTDEAYSWTWEPGAGNHSGAGDAGADYGTMKFNNDGTLAVVQKTVEDGTTTSTETLNGTWSFDIETYKLTMDIGMLHPSTYDDAVANWGDITLWSVNSSVLRMYVMRIDGYQGEGACALMYNYIPAE